MNNYHMLKMASGEWRANGDANVLEADWFVLALLIGW